MARYEVSRSNPDDGNYLEGLTDKDREASLNSALVSGRNAEEGNANWNDTFNNWAAITPGRRAPERVSLEERLLGPRKAAKPIPNENEYLPGMSSYEMHPIKHDSADIEISKQLVDHVNRLSLMQARRPPADYRVESTHNELTNQGYARLVHTPTGKAVGSVEWQKDSGHVDNLEVNEGHRHMTNYLLTQTWNESRATGDKGPASSDVLSPFSEKIVKKYNPDSYGFRLYKSNKEMTCEDCGADGEVRLSATPSEDGRHVRYSEPSGTVGETVSNTPEGREHFTRTVSHRYDVTHQSGGIGVHNPQTGTSHYWHDYHITCPTCQGTGFGRMTHE